MYFGMPCGTEKAKEPPLKYPEKKFTLPFIFLKIILKNFRFNENNQTIVKDFACLQIIDLLKDYSFDDLP